MRSLVVPSLCSVALAGSSFRRSPVYHKDKSVVYYPASYALPENAEEAGVPPPMKLATPDNMDPKLKMLGLDFEGIWWMSDNPVEEELISFANTEVNTEGFPAILEVPNKKSGMWSWTTTAMGYLTRLQNVFVDPMRYTIMNFTTPEEGDISTGLTKIPLIWVESFPFYKYNHSCDDTHGKENCDPTDCAPAWYEGNCSDLITKYPHDKWSRPTIFQERSLFPDTTYTLKRIVYGNGTAHPVYWREWLEHTKTADRQECSWKWSPDSSSWFGGWYKWTCETIPGVLGGVQLASWTTNDQCERKHDVFGVAKRLFGC